MEFYYSSNRNVQMLIAVLKANNIRKVVISPGATHICFAASVQHDVFFELYSAVDERGAAYMACGLAAESGEPVVITCTGATASRNYIPGLTEAYYRKLPVIAVTGSQDTANAGHLIPQFVDRSRLPNDCVKLSVNLQTIKDENDEWDCNVKINRAVTESVRHGGGPVHINLVCSNGKGLVVKDLPPARVIRRYSVNDRLPELPAGRRIAVSVGVHREWSAELTETVDRFCAEHDAVVFVDHSSGYHGRYKILPALAAAQELYSTDMFDIDLLIHIGEQSGDYYTFYRLHRAKEVWRVSEDGEIRDTFRKLTSVFEMSEQSFFESYTSGREADADNYYSECRRELDEIYDAIGQLPLSNIWLAKTMAPLLPENAVLQIGVSNTMRSWTFFDLPDSVSSIANIGCRGIDGTLSAVIGMSMANKDRLHFCVLGDLTFFYNMNALGNRCITNNLRILLVNNGGGTEFHLYQHAGHKQLGDDVDKFVAADGHFQNRSRTLVRDYAESLGFDYLAAESKQEVLNALERFLSSAPAEKPMLFEVFTEHEDESRALELVRNIKKDGAAVMKSRVKNILGTRGTNTLKKIKERL